MEVWNSSILTTSRRVEDRQARRQGMRKQAKCTLRGPEVLESAYLSLCSPLPLSQDPTHLHHLHPSPASFTAGHNGNISHTWARERAPASQSSEWAELLGAEASRLPPSRQKGSLRSVSKESRLSPPPPRLLASGTPREESHRLFLYLPPPHTQSPSLARTRSDGNL